MTGRREHWRARLEHSGGIARLGQQLRRLRGTVLVLLALPLAPALLIALLSGAQRPLLGILLGLGLLALAVRRLRRGRVAQAAALVGAATGLVAGLAGAVPPLGAAVFGAMAFFGTRLLYEDSIPPEPEPVPPAAPGPLDAARARLAALAGADGRLAPALEALRALAAELERRPERSGEARRFLNIQLDGLERIGQRLAQGATPPPGLPALIDDMARGSLGLRDRLRAEETEALEIQVKVLADRLRQEGYAS
ncbi:hypothetical protein CR162_02020 [Pseudoroseomonas rhizosphaerae]|uniref:5-bromo-4-chloroindolyl phosphate hydrolase n=1 Tax=Teichococcus rhizosphaerae TaxID=1335062 RepID=A0A2C7AGT5_9PROT|nr:hypothetical protein [Pseudoroseomonas rhizosphaerae]PHK96705.1 hypothetical protein CR162_02020 [Pseudoroseomonas rhizosphaerae]